MEFTVGQAAAISKLMGLVRALDQVGTSAGNLGKKTKQGAQGVDAQFASIGKKIASTAAGFLGVGSALQAVSTVAGILRSEMEKISKIQIAAADKQESFGDILETLERGLLPQTKFRSKQIGKLIRDFSIEQGADVVEVAEAVRAAISAGDDPADAAVKKRAETGLEIFKATRGFKQEDRVEAASMISLLQQAFPETTATKQQVLVNRAMNISPNSGNMSQFAQTIGAAVGQMGQEGVSEERAFARLLAIQNITQDKPGTVTSTEEVKGLNRAMMQVVAFAAKAGIDKKFSGDEVLDIVTGQTRDPKLRKIGREANKKLLGILSEDLTLEEKKELAETGKLKGKLGGRSKGIFARIQAFAFRDEDFAPKNRVQRRIDENLKSLQLSNKEAAAEDARVTAALKENPHFSVTEASRRGKGLQSAAETDPARGLLGVGIREFRETSARAGMSGITTEAQIFGIQAVAKGLGEAAALDQLAGLTEIKKRKFLREQGGTIGERADFGIFNNELSTPAKLEERAARLNAEQLTLLKEMNDNIKGLREDADKVRAVRVENAADQPKPNEPVPAPQR
jgi:hypothetical protein